MKNKSKSRKGFTLVELIVVVSILAVLAVVAVMAVGNVTSQAREAALQADANTVIRALNTYNSLADTDNIKNDIDALSPDVLRNLTLKVADGDIIDLPLGVDITPDRWEAVEAIIAYQNNMWVRTD